MVGGGQQGTERERVCVYICVCVCVCVCVVGGGEQQHSTIELPGAGEGPSHGQ